MAEHLRVLQVEDSESDAALIVRNLEKSGYIVDAERVETAEQMRRGLARQTWDIIVADYQLPQFDAAEALRIRNATAREIPFIIVSGTIGEDCAVEMMRAGAQDYVLKHRMVRLAPAVQREIQSARARRELRHEYRRVEEQLRLQERNVEERNLDVAESLRENTILLQEVHHRVRNNLQLICSLLAMQIGSMGDDDPLTDPLHRAHHRVLAMALVHEQFFQSKTHFDLNFAEYIDMLAAKLYCAYSIDPTRVKIETQIEPLQLSVDDAMLCGLILNELLANALKHGFTQNRGGVIQVRLLKLDYNRAQLSVSDNGVGLPPGFNYQETSTLGLTLVPALITQLGGDLSVNGEDGAQFTFEWELPKPAEQHR